MQATKKWRKVRANFKIFANIREQNPDINLQECMKLKKKERKSKEAWKDVKVKKQIERTLATRNAIR